MKRLVCAALILLFLCGCHGEVALDEFAVPNDFDERCDYEIVFWAKNDTNKNQTDIYEKAIADFEALYPNIRVKMRLYTDYGKIYNDVITNIATDTTPNVCITYPDHIATYITGKNVVAKLDELLYDEKYGLGGSNLRFVSPKASDIAPEFLSECIVGGSYYALPFMRSSEACYINEDYVKALGYELPDVLTWDFVWEVSDAAAKKDADGNYLLNGQKVMLPFIYKSTDNMIIQMLAQKGAPYSNDDGEILLFNEETKSILKTVAAHTGTGAFSTFKISGYPANFLNAGQCVFAIDSTAGATWMGSKAPLRDISEDKVVEFETAVRPVPQYDAANPKMISQGPSVCIFNKRDRGETLAAWLFAEFLLTDGVQIAYSKTEGYIPVTKTAQNSAEYLDYLAREGEDAEHYDVKIKAVRMLLENAQNTFTTPVFNGSTSVRDAAGQLVEATVKSVRRKENIDDKYFEELFSSAAALYRLDGRGEKTKKAELGPLPSESKALLIALCALWAMILIYVLYDALKNKKS